MSKAYPRHLHVLLPKPRQYLKGKTEKSFDQDEDSFFKISMQIMYIYIYIRITEDLYE